MALPSSGTIKMSQVRDELKKTGPISLGNADVRKLGGKPSGTIKMTDLYGKSSTLFTAIFKSDSKTVKDPQYNAPFYWCGYLKEGSTVDMGTIIENNTGLTMYSCVLIGRVVTRDVRIHLKFKKGTTNGLFKNKILKLTFVNETVHQFELVEYVSDDRDYDHYGTYVIESSRFKSLLELFGMKQNVIVTIV